MAADAGGRGKLNSRVDFYRRLVDLLLRTRFAPWPPYHWDLPQPFRTRAMGERRHPEAVADYCFAVFGELDVVPMDHHQRTCQIAILGT